MTETNKRQDGLLEIIPCFMSFKFILIIYKTKILHAYSLEIKQ